MRCWRTSSGCAGSTRSCPIGCPCESGRMILPDPLYPLEEAEAETAFGAILDGHVTDSEIAAFLIALSDRGETASEIAGAARAMRARRTTISAPANAKIARASFRERECQYV